MRFAVLVLPAVLVAGVIIGLGRRRSPWLATRGWWLVWPLLAVELALLDAALIGLVVLLVGAVVYALDRRGWSPIPR